MNLVEKFHYMRGSYVARMVATLILAMFLLELVFVFYMIMAQHMEFESATVKEGVAIADMLAQSVRFDLYAENVEGFKLPVDAVLGHEDVLKVSLLNRSGKLIYKKLRGGDHASRVDDESSHLEQIMHDLVDKGKRYLLEKDKFYFFAPVYLGNEKDSEEALYFESYSPPLYPELIGHVSIVMSKEFYQQRLKKILVNTVVTALLFLVLGLVATFFIVRNLSRPFSELLQKVRAQSGVTDTSHEDLSLLTSTFDAMLSELEQAFSEINMLKDDLEKKVTLRTRQLVLTNEELSAGKEQLEKALVKLRLTQDQLLHQEKMAAVGRLVAGIAHEMNNSVNYISGAVPPLKRCLAQLQGLEEGQDQKDGTFNELKENIDHLADNIEAGARRLSSILHDLRIFSYKGQDDTPIEVDIHSVIDSLLPPVNGDNPGRVEIIRQYGELDKVCCQPGRISQVFINIISNAIQAMEDGGVLTVRTWQDEEMIHISFKDTGCGIDSDILSRIFEPFYTTKEVGKGTGLGLGLSYSIVRQYGGDIKVESKKGTGTVFDVILPRSRKKII